MNDLLGSLPSEVFTADDSLAGYISFGRAKRGSRQHIGRQESMDGRSCRYAALHRTLHGVVPIAQHAGRLACWESSCTEPSLALNAKDEVELRRSVALETAVDTSWSIFDLFVRAKRMKTPNQARGVRWAALYEGWQRRLPISRYRPILRLADTS